MTNAEMMQWAKAVSDVRTGVAEKIKQLIYKYGAEDNLPYLGDCIVIRQETLDVIFDILAPEMETDEENVQRKEPEDDEDDDIENE